MGVVGAVEPGSKVMYVSPQGDDNNNGLTPETPKRNIQSAVYALHCNGKVFISSGRYNENLMIPKRSNIELVGADKSNTIIDGQDKDICIDIYRDSVVSIQNLMITHGNAYTDNVDDMGELGSGGGVDAGDSDVTIKNCIITQNKANSGGGIFNYGGSVMHIENTVISKNTADCWGIDNEGTLIIKDFIITENIVKEDGGGIVNDGSLTLLYSSVTKNKAHRGGGIYNTNNVNILNIRNSKVVDNISEEGNANIYTYEDDDNN